MMTTDEMAALRRRLAAATSTDWQRLQHYNEAQEEFHVHAAADMATLLAALDAADRQLALADIVARWAWESGPPDDGEAAAAFAAYREARGV